MGTKYKYAFGLLDNARVFVESAVAYASQDNPGQWRFVILHLTTAIELLLKAKLAITDVKYLVAGEAPVTERQFDEGNFRSVGIEDCIETLGRSCGFQLNSRQRHVITTLRNLRNRIAHYTDPSDDVAAVRSAAGAGLNLFIEINDSEFKDEDPYKAKTMAQLVLELRKYDEFVKERLSSFSERLQSAHRPRTHYMDECSHCLQNAAILVDNEIECVFCGHKAIIEEYSRAISDDEYVEKCPDCARKSVVCHQRAEPLPTYECICCGYFRGPEPKWIVGGLERIRPTEFNDPTPVACWGIRLVSF